MRITQIIRSSCAVDNWEFTVIEIFCMIQHVSSLVDLSNCRNYTHRWPGETEECDELSLELGRGYEADFEQLYQHAGEVGPGETSLGGPTLTQQQDVAS